MLKFHFASIISIRSTHLWEREGSSSVPLTNESGAGSGRPKNMRILRIQIRFLIRIPNTASKYCQSVTTVAFRTLFQGEPLCLHFAPQHLLNLDFKADPDSDPAFDFAAGPAPAFICDADPDLTSRNDAKPCGFESATLCRTTKYLHQIILVNRDADPIRIHFL